MTVLQCYEYLESLPDEEAERIMLELWETVPNRTLPNKKITPYLRKHENTIELVYPIKKYTYPAISFKSYKKRDFLICVMVESNGMKSFSVTNYIGHEELVKIIRKRKIAVI
jgi:hypothetical protein